MKIEIAKKGNANGKPNKIKVYKKIMDLYNIHIPQENITDDGEFNIIDYDIAVEKYGLESIKKLIISSAEKTFGIFLENLGVDYKNDDNSKDTPLRVAKKYVLDLWKGRYEELEPINRFKNEGYDELILEKNIPFNSMCSHHHESIEGLVHIAYIPKENGYIVGLSKLNRVVEYFTKRGSIQEQLTTAIHSAINKICEDNLGVMVVVEGTHNCVSCRGVKHKGASMVTSEISGVFKDKNKDARIEVLSYINKK